MYLIYRLSIGFALLTLYFSPFVVSLDSISKVAWVDWIIIPVPSFTELLLVSFVSGMIA